MKLKLLCCGALALAILAGIGAESPRDGQPGALSDAVLLVIRHAEKPATGYNLSPAGEARARAYVDYFRKFTIDGKPLKLDYLFASADSSTSHRPSLTIEPTARALGLTIDTRFADAQFPALAHAIQSQPHGTNILICWHHGEIPQLLRALGADPQKLLPHGKWPDDVFGWLIQLRYDGNGHLAESKRINEDLSPEAAGSQPRLPLDENPSPGQPAVTSSIGPALGPVIAGATTALAGARPASASGGNPAQEMARPATTTGGIDPHGDSLLSIQHSLQQFAHPEFILRLFLSFCLAVGCAWLVAWSPRRSSRLDSLCALEERKALILLGMVGAVVAELSGTSPTLAFVIFGIGALLRFRTVLDNPKLTGKAIAVVVIGLACGMGSWAMAVFVTLFAWLLIFWLESHIACRIRIRLGEDVDPKPVYGAVQSLLISRRCRLQSSEIHQAKGQLVFLLHIPAQLDLRQLEMDLREKLPEADDARIDIAVV